LIFNKLAEQRKKSFIFKDKKFGKFANPF
jgi:hypothetical protein